MHWDAKYCSACGNHLDDDAAAVGAATSPSPRRRQFASERPGLPERGDSFREQEVVHWAEARRARHEGTPGLVMDDPLEEDGAGEDRRHRPVVMVAVVAATLAVVVAVGYVTVARHTVFFERMQGTRDVRASTPATQPEPSADAGPSAVSSISTPPSSTTARPTAEDQAASRSKPAPARKPPIQETRSAGAAVLPAREPASEMATAQGEESPEPEPSRMAASSARTSEERMAAFLVEQLGREGAAEKAQSTAAWYDEGRSERAYWQRVAEAVGRRAGR